MTLEYLTTRINIDNYSGRTTCVSLDSLMNIREFKRPRALNSIENVILAIHTNNPEVVFEFDINLVKNWSSENGLHFRHDNNFVYLKPK